MTSKHWLRMFGVPIARIVSSYSLICLVAICSADSFRELERDFQSVKTVPQAKQVLEKHQALVASDPDLADAQEYIDDEYSVDDVRKLIALRSVSETSPNTQVADAAKAIKSNPLYRDPGIQEQSNWLDGALKRLMDLMPRRRFNPNIQMPAAGIPAWIVPAVWTLLGAIAVILLYLVLRHVSWKRSLKRKATAILEEDEPDRSLDEWLALADEYAASGKYREAVRAMYLSCLLKFDQAGVARFVRGETNWEHLARIQASQRLPHTIDFLAPTQSFDRIWYGFHVRGEEDFQQFRTWYQSVSSALHGVSR